MNRQDIQPDTPPYTRWRNLDMQQAQELVASPGWESIVDERGRNAAMNALYCFAPPVIQRFLLAQAHEQGVLASLCQSEDFLGARLPAYALREGLNGLSHQESWEHALFSHGVHNSRGEGLFAQMLARNLLDDEDLDHGSFLLRGIAFDAGAVEQLTPHDWQAGLDIDKFAEAWSKQVLINDAPLGVAYTLDMNGFAAWVMPKFRADPSKWNPDLAECLSLIDTAAALIKLDADVSQDRLVAEDIVRLASPGLRRMLPHQHRRRASLIPYILSYQGWGDVWQAFLSQEQAGELSAQTITPQVAAEPRRI